MPRSVRRSESALDQSLLLGPAAALDVSPPNLAVLLDRLAQRALVERLPNPDYGRSHLLALTAAGRTLLAHAEQVVVRLERDASASSPYPCRYGATA